MSLNLILEGGAAINGNFRISVSKCSLLLCRNILSHTNIAKCTC